MKLLVATDGSKASEGAVKYAARLFTSIGKGSHITLITVQDDSSLRLFKKYTQKGQSKITCAKVQTRIWHGL